jgi:hypothetical protein
MERTRRRLLTAAGGAAVAAAAGVVIATDDGSEPKPKRTREQRSKGATSRTTDRFGLGDVGIANFLLTVQRIERDLYASGLASGTLQGDVRDLFAEFGAQERRHVARLERTVKELGARTVRPPRTEFPLASAVSFVQFAVTVEDVSASACLGQLAAIDTRHVREAVLAIHTTDARHAATFGLLVGLDPTPDGARAEPADAAAVLAKLRPVLR